MTSTSATETETPIAQKRVTLPNGIILPYAVREATGDCGDDATIVVAIHGATDSSHSFELLIPHLPPSFHFFAVTLPGHGDADRPETGYRINELAEVVVAWMDAVGITRAQLLGHSMGTAVALRLAAEHPARVEGLALLGAFATLHDNEAVQELWDEALAHLEDPVDRAFVEEFQKSTLGGEVLDAFFQNIVAESAKVPARVWRALFQGFLDDDLTAPLAKITAPIRLFWGEDDVFCSMQEQERLMLAASEAPDVSLNVYARAGHALHWEMPERIAHDFAAWIAELASVNA